jgi:hypothetical protein
MTIDMTLKRWYQLCLLLPLAFPLFLAALSWLFTGSFMGGQAPRPEMVMPFLTLPVIALQSFSFLLLTGLMLSGIQYLIFIGFLMWFYKDRDTVFWGRLSFLLPVVFVPVCALGLFLYNPGTLFLAFFAIPYGYLYVLIAHLLTLLLLRLGKLPRE